LPKVRSRNEINYYFIIYIQVFEIVVLVKANHLRFNSLETDWEKSTVTRKIPTQMEPMRSENGRLCVPEEKIFAAGAHKCAYTTRTNLFQKDQTRGEQVQQQRIGGCRGSRQML
jgi:hypothetical protein